MHTYIQEEEESFQLVWKKVCKDFIICEKTAGK